MKDLLLFAILGLGAGASYALIALGIVLVLTVYGELRSISATIDRVPPLRWLDSLGRA